MKIKKIVILIMALLILSALAGIMYIQISNCLKPKEITVSILEYDKVWSFKDQKDLYERKVNEKYEGYQFIRKNNVFPSDVEEDYCTVVVRMKVKNRSILKCNIYSSYLLSDDEDSLIIMTNNTIRVANEGFKEIDDLRVISLEIYRGDMTDEEILEYIKTLKLEVYYGNTIDRNNTLKLDLKDYDVKLSDR